MISKMIIDVEYFVCNKVGNVLCIVFLLILIFVTFLLNRFNKRDDNTC